MDTPRSVGARICSAVGSSSSYMVMVRVDVAPRMKS
jgi:hypothetical protein